MEKQFYIDNHIGLFKNFMSNELIEDYLNYFNKCEQQGASSPKFEEECPLDQEDIGNEMFDAEGNILNVNR